MREALERPVDGRCYGVDLIVDPGFNALKRRDEIVLSGAVDGWVFWEDIADVASEVWVGADGQHMRDVFVLPEGEDRGGVVLDEVWRLAD